VEKIQQDDDGQRDADQPQQESSHDTFLLDSRFFRARLPNDQARKGVPGTAPRRRPLARRRSFMERRKAMLQWALMFLVLALIAGVLGFGGIAAISANIAQVLFVVFLILFLIAAAAHAFRGKAPPAI
jgi:uncharacterized membrane protein YtjA (UPF0391 family)